MIVSARSQPQGSADWPENGPKNGSERQRMAGLNPIQFIQEVRQEVAKVTWPTWKEVWITTVMVLIMVTLAAAFFTTVDLAFGLLIKTVLGIAG